MNQLSSYNYVTISGQSLLNWSLGHLNLTELWSFKPRKCEVECTCNWNFAFVGLSPVEDYLKWLVGKVHMESVHLSRLWCHPERKWESQEDRQAKLWHVIKDRGGACDQACSEEGLRTTGCSFHCREEAMTNGNRETRCRCCRWKPPAITAS